jgi:hypothetical protein
MPEPDVGSDCDSTWATIGGIQGSGSEALQAYKVTVGRHARFDFLKKRALSNGLTRHTSRPATAF